MLIVTSTFGDGEPPENAKAFHAALHAAEQPRLEKLEVLRCSRSATRTTKSSACADRSSTRAWPASGAQRLYERADCDVDFEAAFEAWQNGVFAVLEAMAGAKQRPGPPRALPEPKPAARRGTPGRGSVRQAESFPGPAARQPQADRGRLRQRDPPLRNLPRRLGPPLRSRRRPRRDSHATAPRWWTTSCTR